MLQDDREDDVLILGKVCEFTTYVEITQIYFYTISNEQYNYKKGNIVQDLTLRQKLNQMFILGYQGENPDSENNSGFINLLKNGLGGVIFFTDNIKDKNSFKNAVKTIKSNALIPPFLSIDQEGGRVERTLNIYKGSHYLSARYAALKGEDFIYKQTTAIAKELQEFGLNMNFAPVLDVDTNPNNPVIAERSFSSDPDIVTKFGKIAAKAYLEYGIIPVGKHFPGHGETSVDSHKEMPELSLSLDELENIHIRPFKKLLPVLPALMIAHIHYTAFDKEKIPASISKNVINGYLRNKLNYKGLVISDDMVMGGIQGFSSLEACVKGINAGINMFIFRNSDTKIIKLLDALEKEILLGNIDIENINKSIKIIKQLKCC